MILLSGYAAAIALGLLLIVRWWLVARREPALPCRQCAAPMPRGSPAVICPTCLRIQEELRVSRAGWQPAASLQWFVRRKGEQLGPYRLTALRSLAERGKLAAGDLLWTEGMGRWLRAEAIPGLLPPAARAAGRAQSRMPPAKSGTPAARQRSAAAAVAPSASPAEPGYFALHWRGDLPLADSYWLGWLPVTLLLVVVLAATAAGAARGGSLWGIAVLTAAATVAIWQAVGLWRSADRHVARGGKKAWTIAAKACVILGLLPLAGPSLRQLLLLQQALAPGARSDMARAAELHVLDHGTAVEIAGAISPGTADVLRILLDATPTIHLVQLDATGGGLAEATRTGRLITARGLATFTARDCDSGCLLAFLSGKQRYLGSQARLGFRGTSATDAGARAHLESELLRRALLAQGVPAAFTDKALATSPAGIWYPSTQELLEAHVVTAVVDEREYARYGFNAARAELEAAFMTVPVFAVLQRLEPATFASLRETYVSGVLGGVPRNEMTAKVRATMMEKVIPKYVRMAPDHELIAYWRTQLDKARELRAIDPRYCVEFLAPQPGTDTTELAGMFSAKAQAADVQALADLMLAGARHPQSTPPEEAVRATLRESARRAEQIVPGAVRMVENPVTAAEKPAEFCHAEVAFYESILALPSDRAGPVLRFLVAQG